MDLHARHLQAYHGTIIRMEYFASREFVFFTNVRKYNNMQLLIPSPLKICQIPFVSVPAILL